MNPILQRLEQEIAAQKDSSIAISYNVRLSRNHLRILSETAERLGIKQSEVIRLSIQNLPDLLK